MAEEQTAVASRLQEEIRQTVPFRSAAQEVVIAVARTADVLRRRIEQALAPYDLTGQQYNVLRILRGARGKPLPTLEIGERMIERTPGVTRLIDRLEAKGLVRRARCLEDRRIVYCHITEAGLDLLRVTDPVVNAFDELPAQVLTAEELRSLSSLLERVRTHADA